MVGTGSVDGIKCDVSCDIKLPDLLHPGYWSGSAMIVFKNTDQLYPLYNKMMAQEKISVDVDGQAVGIAIMTIFNIEPMPTYTIAYIHFHGVGKPLTGW